MMSGFTVADLIKPTLESVNSSQKQQLYEGSRKVKTRENANSENRNIKQKNNHDNNVYNRSVILDPLNVFNVDKNSLDRVCSTENNVGKKSDIDNDSTVLSCNLNSEKSVFRSKIIPNCISSSILTGNERNNNLMPSSIMSTSPFNSDNNLPVDEVTNHPLFQAYSEPSLFTTSFQQISSTDVTFIPTVVSSSSSLSPPSSLQNSSGTSQCHWNITNPNTEDQLQILLKLHNLFGLSIFDKSNLTSMNSISLKGEDSTFNNQLFLNNIISNSKTSLSDQNQSNLSLNFNSETISPINSSSYMMSIMMNALINKELLEHLHPLSPFQHEALSHHQHRKLMQQQQQQQKLHYQQSPEIVPQLTVSDQNQILANILTSRLFLDNNENFIKDSMQRNVLMTSDNRKPKRIRTAFSPSQLFQLESAFEKNHYVVGQERKDLATELNLTETQVKVWFQNRRTKHKRLHTDAKDVLSNSTTKERRLISDSDDDSDDGDEDVEQEGENEEENFENSACHPNQLRVDFIQAPFSKRSLTEFSNGTEIKTFQSTTKNNEFSPTDEHQRYNILKSNCLSDNQLINDSSDNQYDKSRAYPKCDWDSFKQIHDNFKTMAEIQTEQLSTNHSILHSSHHILHSVIGHTNQQLEPS